VLTPDAALPFGKARDHALGDVQIVDENGGADDVRDGVERADFMEVDLLHGDAVSLTFRLGHDGKNLLRQLRGPGRHHASVDDGADVGEIPVFVVMVFVVVFMIVMMMFMLMVMVMLVFMMMFVIVVMVVIFEDHVEGTAFQTFGLAAADGIGKSRHVEAVQDGVEFFPAAAQIQQGGDSHIPGDAGGTFKIEEFSHFPFTSFC
jgi:hypothetical protein